MAQPSIDNVFYYSCTRGPYLLRCRKSIVNGYSWLGSSMGGAMGLGADSIMLNFAASGDSDSAADDIITGGRTITPGV